MLTFRKYEDLWASPMLPIMLFSHFVLDTVDESIINDWSTWKTFYILAEDNKN